MKQQISLKQWNALELSKRQLFLKGYRKAGHTFAIEVEGDENGIREIGFVKGKGITIGQMLEFIVERYSEDEEFRIDMDDEWYISTYEHFPLDEEMEELGRGKELCDALWSAVKYILSKTNGNDKY